MKTIQKITLFSIIFSCIWMTGCGSTSFAQESNFDSAFAGSQETTESTIGNYDSADTAVVKGVNQEEGNIALINLDTGKVYTLNYDGTTYVSDKYGSSMAMNQVKSGEIVQVAFMADTKQLVNLNLFSDAWSYDGINKYTIDNNTNTASIGDSLFDISTNAYVQAMGEEEDLSQIIQNDILTVKGIGHTIYSIQVEKGHGYLRLSDDTYVTGGWIEVGQSIITQITEGMLLTVPEGDYSVHLTARGVDVTKEIQIIRNQESTLDMSDVEVEEIQTGRVLFTIYPEDAKVEIDGQEVDTSYPVSLDYGLHQIVTSADGYRTLKQYIKVGQELATITINLDAADLTSEDETTTDTTASGTVSGNTLTSTTAKIYVDSPTGVEVYFDSVYMGIAPVSFAKSSGTHTITLRKSGYITRSYTVSILTDDNDVTYSFTDLEEGDSSTVQTISGNKLVTTTSTSTVSGNE